MTFLKQKSVEHNGQAQKDLNLYPTILETITLPLSYALAFSFEHNFEFERETSIFPVATPLLLFAVSFRGGNKKRDFVESKRTRTYNPLFVRQMLSQLSYTLFFFTVLFFFCIKIKRSKKEVKIFYFFFCYAKNKKRAIRFARSCNQICSKRLQKNTFFPKGVSFHKKNEKKTSSNINLNEDKIEFF